MHFDWYIDCLHYAHHSSRLTFQKSAPRCERFFMHFSPGARLHLWSRRSPGMADWVQERKTEICSLRFFEPEGFWVQKARFTNQIQRIFTNSIVFRYSRGFFKSSPNLCVKSFRCNAVYCRGMPCIPWLPVCSL